MSSQGLEGLKVTGECGGFAAGFVSGSVLMLCPCAVAAEPHLSLGLPVFLVQPLFLWFFFLPSPEKE